VVVWFRQAAESRIVRWEDKSSDQGFRQDLGGAPTYPTIFTVELDNGDVYDLVWGLNAAIMSYPLDHRSSRKNGRPAEAGEFDAVARLVYDHTEAGPALQDHAGLAIEKARDWERDY
jgi:hypothetical protein